MIFPQWAIAPLRYQQEAKVKHSPGFDEEVRLAKKLYELEECDTLIDLGCWLGVLGMKFKKVIKPNKLYLIDAIPLYLNVAQTLFKECYIDATFIEMCIVPDPASFNRRFNVILNDSINTSSAVINKKYDPETIIVSLPTTSNIVDPMAAATALKLLCGEQGYLKMDIDGMDYTLIDAILASDFRPRVLHFEGLKYQFTDQLKLIIQKIRAAGYQLPPDDQILAPGTDMCCITCSANHWGIIYYKVINGIMTYQPSLTMES